MDAREDQERFRLADTLFRAGDFHAAFGVLRELNVQYPNTKNILYPLALCLERLGRADEARPLCQQLMEQFQDVRATEMWSRLARPAPAGLAGVDELLMDDFSSAYALPDLGATRLPPVPEYFDEVPSRWPAYFFTAAGVLALGGLLLARAFLGDGGSGPGTHAPPSPYQAGAFIAVVVLFFGLSQIVGTVAAIFALATIRKLRDNTIGGNILDVGSTLFVYNLAWFIIALVLGRIDSLYVYLFVFCLQHLSLVLLFNHQYKLGVGGMFIFGFMFLILMIVLFFLPFFVLLSLLGMASFFLL